MPIDATPRHATSATRHAMPDYDVSTEGLLVSRRRCFPLSPPAASACRFFRRRALPADTLPF